MSRRVRFRAGLLALTVPPLLAACDLLMTEPAPPLPEVAVSFALSEGGASAVEDVFNKVRIVHLTFFKSDSSARDTTVRVIASDGEARVRLSLEAQERISALLVDAKLGISAGVLFEGQRIVRIEVGKPTSAQIPISPVPNRVRADRALLEHQSIGDTARLSAAVLFLTGDTIPGWPTQWTSENSEIVFVTAQGLTQARGVGQTRLLVQSGDLVDTVFARVLSDR